MSPSPLTYTVEAYNLSHASENKIHDDTVAQKLGFSGGLVPGVEVFAYASHPMIERYGTAFLERGRLECRFFKPVYDGRLANVTATEDGDGLEIKVESEGELCATGRGSMPSEAPQPPALGDLPTASPPADRPPADETSLAEGRALGIAPATLTKAQLDTYLADVRETSPVYADEGLAHPGILLRLCNSALRENVVLPPWIHTGSKMQNLAAARVGDELTVRARVVSNYERKGHRLVDLDCLIVANGDKPIAHVLHTAIYRLRHLAA